jgi:hypothetical protein
MNLFVINEPSNAPTLPKPKIKLRENEEIPKKLTTYKMYTAPNALPQKFKMAVLKVIDLKIGSFKMIAKPSFMALKMFLLLVG